MPYDQHTRDLARAIALDDTASAKASLDLLVREGRLNSHEVDLGRSDAAATLRRSALSLAA